MKIKSFGKINLNLRVLDELVNGLHKIESLIVPIDLYDVIEISKVAFQQKRKKIKTALSEYIDEDIAEKVSLNLDVRPQE